MMLRPTYGPDEDRNTRLRAAAAAQGIRLRPVYGPGEDRNRGGPDVEVRASTGCARSTDRARIATTTPALPPWS